MGLGKVILKIEDPILLAELSGVPETVGGSDGLVITDNPNVGRTKSGRIAYVGLSLCQTMKVISHADAILKPTAVTDAHLGAIAAGSRVYSTLDAERLQIDEVTHALVSQLAAGGSPAQVAQTVGYSERHVRRITGRLLEQAGLSRFEWTQLAPLFTAEITR